MNNTYEIPLIVNDQYQHDYMAKLITNLENLEVLKSNVFNRMNQALSERVSKLENLKSRINRAIKIIASYESPSSQAMTMKSKLVYPLEEPTYTKSVHFDQNANVSIAKPAIPLLNANKKNNSTVLGNAPRGNIQEAEITQLTHNFFSLYKDVNTVIHQIHCNPSRLADDSVTPILESYNSAFNIFDKSIIIGKKTQTISTDVNNEYVNLAGFLQTTEKNKKKVIQDAPESILRKQKLSQLDKKRNVHLQNQVEVNINLPNMMNLGNIADFGIEKDLFEQPTVDNNVGVEFNEDDDVQYDQRISSMDDDINTPMDFIKNRKGVNPPVKTTTQSTVQPTTYTVSSTAQSTSVPQVSTSISSVPSIPQVPVVTSNSGPGIPLPPPMAFSVAPQKVQSSSVPIPPPQVKSSSIPNPPSIPSVPVVVSGGGPGVPLPPPMPMINLSLPKIPSEPIEKAPTEKKVVAKKEEPRQLTMQEEIGANPMARLKKIGDIKVTEKVETKKQATTTDMMSLLKAQIGLRFKNLHKHEEENKSDSNSDSDD